ncbi:xanthine dehydrogenase family protein subunit M [Saccharopolyspora rhizosphaerae]|uniref:Xanthine dehydrogenase family protein subunit M n=1 Tax=Saccharopolyspora rhizosphaerae TaxID=2492662 RepID=A0A426K362_9PSEU|nr:xanthine dehydrogenase family protein subunit M [Saccharopolyspora rhizosphaerae]RRO19905.1 xanthine dehydrogenase family protein subunit M [Saccharopolyspora rhizosphaerae]
MRPFHYQRATDVDAAVSTLADTPGAEFLAGGTNLVDLMKLEVTAPDVLVDVRQLTSDQVEDHDGTLRIGASVTNSALAANPLVRERFPVLSQAVLAGASAQLRNLATTGGNLLQRTRCGYFQDVSTPCNKRDPGSGCSALDGFHREHAIFGASRDCVATHPSDMAVALVALDAVVNTVGPAGPRSIELIDLHRLPGSEPQRDTVLEHGELITSVDVPPLRMATTSRYRKARDRTSFAFALVSVAAALDVVEGAVRDVRLALGGVAHKPWRATTAEAALRGEPATAEAFRRAADAELEGADPLPGNEFKVQLVRNMITGALSDLAGVRR